MTIRIPIRYVTVFGVTALIALAVGLVFFLSFVSATKNTRLLMSDQAEVMINAMERDLALWLKPVKHQANWIANYIANHPKALDDIERFDDFMLGTLAATGQVAGIAVARSDGIVRRWTRSTGDAITEDWSSRPDINEWITSGSQRTESAWFEPFFTDTIGQTVLLHDIPVRDSNGNLMAMVGQIVPIAELSTHIAELAPREGMTPFILYGKDRVLAHPQLTRVSQTSGGTDIKPLMPLTQLEDIVLNRIWSPDEEELFFLGDNNEFQTAGTFIEENERFYVYLYQFVEGYGPIPWVIGAYLDTEIYGGAETQRLIRTLVGSVLVLLVAMAGAVLLGRYITRPVTAIAEAASLVEANKLSEIPSLPSSRMRELDDASRSINQMIIDLRERTLIRQTLGQFVPEAVARTLLSEGGELPSKTSIATVLYSDVEGFTQLTESLGAAKMVEVLNAYFSTMVSVLEHHQGVVTQFHGDAMLATFNIPIDNQDHAMNAMLAASDMLNRVDTQLFAGQRLQIRIGIDTGPVMAGAVGAIGRLSYTVYGNSVNLASRLEQLNKEFGSRLLLSENTAKLAGDDIKLRFVSEVPIRGQSRPMKAYTLDP